MNQRNNASWSTWTLRNVLCWGSVHHNWLFCCLSLCISLVSCFYATLGLVWRNLLLYRIVAGKIITKQCLFPTPSIPYRVYKRRKAVYAAWVIRCDTSVSKSRIYPREKKWSPSSEWETIGQNGFCNPLLQIKRNPTYRVIIYISKVLEQYFTAIPFRVFFCTLREWNLGVFLSYDTVRSERVTVPSMRSCLKQPFPKPACQAFE